jgi:hypothetical protein
VDESGEVLAEIVTGVKRVTDVARGNCLDPGVHGMTHDRMLGSGGS